MIEVTLALFIVAAGWCVFVGLPLLVIYYALKNWINSRYDEWQVELRTELKAQRKKNGETEPVPSGAPAAKYHDFDMTYRKLDVPPLAINPVKPPFPTDSESIPLADLPGESKAIVVNEQQTADISAKDSIETVESETTPISIDETSGLPVFADPDPVEISSAITSTFPAISEETYRIQGEKELPPKVTLLEKPFVDWQYEPTSNRQEHKPKQTPDNILKNLELQIGRKVMGWVAVVLFVLAGAFFVQLAISQGWLNPNNRFYGMFLTGLILLGGGVYFFRKGWRRYSEMVNSAGIITLLSAAWYAQRIAMFPSGITFALQVATVVGGLLLAGIYRSQVTSLVATLGGLSVPLLVSHTYWSHLIIWLLVLNFSVIVLVNLLERSTVAGLSWVGSLGLMSVLYQYCPGNNHGLTLTVGFFAGFAILHYMDLLAAAFRPTRRLGLNDFWRALLTPLVLLFVLYHVFYDRQFSNTTFCGLTPVIFFDRFDSWFTLFLVFVMGQTAWLIARADHIIKYLRPDDTRTMLPNRNVSLVTACLILMFCLLAIFILFAFNTSWYSTGFLAVSCGLLYATGKSFHLFYLSHMPNDTEHERPMPHYGKEFDLGERTLFLVWSLIFCVPGVLLLLFHDFLPHFVPTEAFVDGAGYLIHRLALPVLIGSMILMSALGLVIWSKRRTPDADSSTEISQSRFTLSAIYAAIGFMTFWGLLTSEIYTGVMVHSMENGLDTARLAGWGSVLLAWLGLGLLVWLIGSCFHSLAIRITGLVVLTATLFKITFVDLMYHPVFQLIGGHSISVEHLRYDAFSLIGVPIPRFPVPILNGYSMPILIVIISLLLLGIVMRYKMMYRRNEAEYAAGLTVGLWSTVLLWLMGSLETLAFFEFGGLEVFEGTHYFAIFGLFYFWSIWALLLLGIGLATHSRPIRILTYVLLFLETPMVMYYTFCHNFRFSLIATQWPILNFSGISVLLFALLLVGIGWGICRKFRLSEHAEKQTAAILGSIGVVIGWLLFTFEVWRFCTGHEWLGPNEWTRMVALSILWSLIIFIVILVEKARDSLLLRFIIFTLSLILCGKVVLFEIAFRDHFSMVLMNPYGLECFLSSLYLIGVSIYFSSRATARLLTFDKPDPRDRMEKYAWRLMLITGIIIMWLSSSIDVFSAIRIFPGSGKLTAQMALSILWSCFAGLLLAIGFWRKSMLARWLAICLFGMTTLKVLTVDLAYVGQVGRVAAYLTLAIVLAIAAAAYQRFRG